MERAAWTDERLDDLAEAMRTGFDRVHQDLRDLRGDVTAVRSEGRDDIATLRTEIHSGFDRLNSKMDRFGGGIIIALIGVIAAILARGV
jgi:hypothetical protein